MNEMVKSINLLVLIFFRVNVLLAFILSTSCNYAQVNLETVSKFSF